MKKLKYYLLFLLLPTVRPVCGQHSLNIIDLYYETSFGETARSVQQKANVGVYAFHSNVGGVAFESVAMPSRAVENSPILLGYESGRFVVTVGGRKIYPNLPDWQLIPVVKFVASQYNVLFSPMGDTDSGKEAQCRYHPAFLNTLTGLRIFQADLLNYPSILWDLPKDRKGEYLLAASEKAYVPKRDGRTEKMLYDVLCGGDGRPFTHFILTDRNVKPTFDVKNGTLCFTGHPYYLFTNDGGSQERFESLLDELEQAYADIEKHSRMFLGDKYRDNLNPRTNLAGLLETLDANQNDAFSNSPRLREIIKALERLDSLNQLTDKQIGMTLSVLERFSTAFNRHWERLKQYNPAVYSTVETIAQWSAFFRYVKQKNPANWKDFVEKTGRRTVTDAPKILTPTAYEVDYFKLIDLQ